MLQLPAVERQRWLKAVDAELSTLEKHRVWEMTALPVGKQVISAKWVFRVKRDEQDNVYTYKARLVARGFTQLQGRDYDETFAPVVRYETVRAFLAVAAVKSMHVRHIDVKTAYLSGELNVELFMELPPGFKQQSTEGKVLRLRRSLYGLKQSARMWNQVATDALKKMDFRSNRTDPCFFSRVEKEHGITYVLLYVDDLLMASASSDLTHHVEQQLNGYFEVKDLSEVWQYLGIQVERGEDGSFLLHQSGKICRLIQEHGLLDAKPVATPMETNFLSSTAG
uniref:Reverse transcriptase Ty1/copia-type domain-containing protein n=1 Tax=Trichuris muris TaxID=70415 RepID=A0A5S6QZI5_TRIMR